MTPNRPEDPMSDLETLSALFDGELDGDAARFAARRLGHDAEWQQACGRWQLVGDVLRGNSTSAASAGFAARVSDAVAREAVPVMVPEPRSAVRAAAPAKPRRWIAGAALAASVAAAALFVARPGLQPQPVASPPVAAAPVAPAPIAAPDASTAIAAAPGTPAVDATPAVLRAEPRREARATRPTVARARDPATADAARIARARAATAALAAQSVASTTSGPALAEAVADPFHPAQAAITTRPWPRAVLPGSAAAGALTASFGGAPQSGSPSFYPFEPRLPAESAATSPAPQP